MKYYSTKTYGHNEGLSCAFRQWKATSHCAQLHGYAISVKIVFKCNSLDDKNWVQDFGGLKPVKEWLKQQFDHKTCVAADDPDLDTFKELDRKGLIQLNVLPSVGCEKFAEHVFNFVDNFVNVNSNGRVRVDTVEIAEHGGNSAFVSAE